MLGRGFVRGSRSLCGYRTLKPSFYTRYSLFATEAEGANQKKMTAAEVPHPHDFFDGDPVPHIREALSNGPRSLDDSVDPEIDQLTQDMCSLNIQELTQVNFLVCKKLGLDPDILSVLGDAFTKGASGGSAEPEKPAFVDSGFRRIVIREVPKGVKERFPIMKLMRAEDEALSLADCKKILESEPATLFQRIDKAKADEITGKLSEMGVQSLAELVD